VKGWPGCLQAVAAVILNIQEERKFTLGQQITVLVSHMVSAVLEAKGGHWLSPQRFLRYQAVLVEQDDVKIVVTNIVNPASFLSGNMGQPVHHECLETIEATYASRLDWRDSPMENGENWFTDGSSYVLSGKRHAGYAVTTSQEIIKTFAHKHLCAKGRNTCFNQWLGIGKRQSCEYIHRLEVCLRSCACTWGRSGRKEDY